MPSRIIRIIAECRIEPTANGKIYVHPEHGKKELAENLAFARWRAEQFGEEVVLLPNPQHVKSADSYNITRGVLEEYKINKTSTKESIDNLIRRGKDQASHIILQIDSDISKTDLRDAIYNRVRRADNFKELRLRIGDTEAIYSRNLGRLKSVPYFSSIRFGENNYQYLSKLKSLLIFKMNRLFMYLLPWKDSNPHRRNQNPTCYHYTTRQSLVQCSFTGTKVGIIFISANFLGIYFFMSHHFL